ncbi:unnamed protein product, partial [Amoebophrya sp. A25]
LDFGPKTLNNDTAVANSSRSRPSSATSTSNTSPNKRRRIQHIIGSHQGHDDDPAKLAPQKIKTTSNVSRSLSLSPRGKK